MPESWVKYTQDNLSRCQHEREVSARLRGAVDACVRACANEMWAQHNTVNNSLNARVQQLEGAKEGLQAHLQKVGYDLYPSLHQKFGTFNLFANPNAVHTFRRHLKNDRPILPDSVLFPVSDLSTNAPWFLSAPFSPLYHAQVTRYHISVKCLKDQSNNYYIAKRSL